MSGLDILVAAGVPAVVAALWFSHRFGWWRGTVDEGLPRILMYHMVREHVPGSRANKMRVRPEDFDAQVRWLKENGWEFVTVSEIADRREGGKRVAITFDDGYRDNLVHALPILQKHGAKMTLYLVADRESCPDWPAQRRASRAGSDLSKEERLTDDEVREMVASGLVELGSHTMNHVDLTQVDEETKRRELAESKCVMEELSGQPVRTFCYPFGLFAEGDPERLRELGYEAALTVEQGISDPVNDDPMHWKRVKVSGVEGMFAFRLRMRTGVRGWKR
jgi:peptidoglycan/xylan/chitin deacetylase (PgdA/CDA1 family)